MTAEFSQSRTPVHPILALWLLGACAMVVAMILIGAVTRLTESGLSMVEWRPFIGWLPPLGQAEWERVFALYQQTPQYQKVTFWMELSDFKKIFFWEWFHRFWGRVIFFIYAVPLAVIWMKGMVSRSEGARLLGLSVLVVLQGVMGMLMVRSGLVEQPAVSHYRLAAHLFLAFLLLGLTLWQALMFLGVRRTGDTVLFRAALAGFGFLSLTVLWGAFVAGKDAGLIYNEFPLMGGGIVPPEMWQLSPSWMNFFENIAGIQFTHRWLGIVTGLSVLAFWAAVLWRGRMDIWFQLPGIMALGQIGLGIATLLSGVALPLAVAHQGGAVCLFMLLIVCLYKAKTD